MSGKSIWIDSTSVALSVYTNTNDDFSGASSLLWTGPLALGGSISFADEAGWDDPAATLTLSVDAAGVVSLTSSIDPSGGSGRKFLVMVAPVGIDIAQCQWAQMIDPPGSGVWVGLYTDSLSVPWATQWNWTDPQTVPPSIQAGLGYGGGWNGF